MGSSRKRMRRSREQWEQIVSEQAGSGLSQSAFCRREGISLASFGHWRARLRTEVARAAPFVEWTVRSAEPQALQPGEMELVLPGGVRLRLRV